MAKPEWGEKQVCESCGARFYDLGRKPIVCPKCDTEQPPRPTKRRPAARAAPAKDRVAAEPKAAANEVAGADEAAADVEDEDDEDGIEDPSDRGEDEEDVAEVIAPGTAPKVEET